MASKDHDRMLEVLRSLTRPGVLARGEPPGADVASEREGARPAGGAAPADEARVPVPERRASEGWAIQLRMEEVGVFFLAGVVLVVMAFLMGWYGRGTGAPRTAVDARVEGLPRDDAPPLDPQGQNLGARPGRVEGTQARPAAAYSILLARFPPGGAGDAEDHRLSLKQRGYPGRLRRTAEAIELCVGRFDSPDDALARQWLPKLQKLSPAYASARVVRIP